MEQEYPFYAFISYSSKDTAWGKRLQSKLEGYRMPATLCSEHGWERKPINPVFFAPTDIQPGGLSAELQERLRASRHLIVICSPHSARSQWVGREIEYFHSLGRTQQIHFFIVDGHPHSGDPATECFNPVVERLGLPEILGANIHEHVYRWPWLNRERAYVQLVTKLLGVEFDSIWQRHRRLLRRQALAWFLGLLAVVAALLLVWRTSLPFDASVQLREATPPCDSLPPLHDAVLTLSLDNEVKTSTIHSLSESVTLTNIPRRFLDHRVHVSIVCPDYLPLDTTVVLSRQLTLPVSRDPQVYGTMQFLLWSEQRECTLPGVPVTVAGIPAVSDAEGRVCLSIPLERQRLRYPVSSTAVQLLDTQVDAQQTESTVVTVQ